MGTDGIADNSADVYPGWQLQHLSDVLCIELKVVQLTLPRQEVEGDVSRFEVLGEPGRGVEGEG